MRLCEPRNLTSVQNVYTPGLQKQYFMYAPAFHGPIENYIIIIVNESISELFAHKYNALYNAVCYNTILSIQLNNLTKMNESDIMTKCSTNVSPLINKHLHSVSVNQLQYAINRLKSSKSGCTDQLFSDHFINGTVRFYTLIYLLLVVFLLRKNYLMLSLAMSVRPSVRPSSVEISLERGCTITNRPINLKFLPIYRGWGNACLKEVWFRNSNCKL